MTLKDTLFKEEGVNVLFLFLLLSTSKNAGHDIKQTDSERWRKESRLVRNIKPQGIT